MIRVMAQMIMQVTMVLMTTNLMMKLEKNLMMKMMKMLGLDTKQDLVDLISLLMGENMALKSR